MVTTIFDWRDLPFREIWCVDTEFYPGAGLANGAVHGDAMTPLCLVARENAIRPTNPPMAGRAWPVSSIPS
jgi:hypothetical protein